MIQVAFFDTKSYEKKWFPAGEDIRFEFFETKLEEKTAHLAAGYDCVCVFVNDELNAAVLRALKVEGVRLVALRCSGYNNVDMEEAKRLSLPVVRVPSYSPYAVAEHAMAMLLTLNRKIHRAYIRTRDFNFSLRNLEGFDLHGKTAGVIGTGRIGQCFINICKGFGMNVLAYDPYPMAQAPFVYTDLPSLFRESDVISLHCPLTPQTHHIVDGHAIQQMKRGVYLVNTSRGALIESRALLDGLTEGKIGGACLDVYEEEADLFYRDNSFRQIEDQTLALLLSSPNVLVTSHQAYFTREALSDIARTTLDNIRSFFRN